jgi:predicted Fe-Mo cluster-binding NifX family protein
MQNFQLMAWKLKRHAAEGDDMKIAIPVQGDHVATVFDAADDLLMIDKGPGPAMDSSRQSFTMDINIDKVAFLKEWDVDVLICGALSGFMRRMIEAAGIRVTSFIRGPVEEVVDAFFRGKLEERQFFMPGCCPGPYPVPRRRRLRGGFENRRCLKR